MVKDTIRSVKLGRLPALIKTLMNELDKFNDEMSSLFALAFLRPEGYCAASAGTR